MRHRKALRITGFLLAFLVFVAFPAFSADDFFRLDFDFDSRNTIDSKRTEYFKTFYEVDSPQLKSVASQRDESFFGTENNMFLALRGDLNETQFLDFKETLFYQNYDPGDPLSKSYDSFRYKYLDHQFNLTWGIAAGDHDFFKLDFYNKSFDVNDYSVWKASSNIGKALFSHEFSERTCLSIIGGYEEREYANDIEANYREGTARFELTTFMPGYETYTPIANSIRGEKSLFENYPNGMSAKNAVNYYTNYVRDPRDDDPRAKYTRKKTRGDLYLRFVADFISQDRLKIDNGFNETAGEFEATYEIGQDISLRVNDRFSKRDYEKETNLYFLHDFSNNYFSLSSSFETAENFFQQLTFINEAYNFTSAPEEDYKTNSLIYEGFYKFGKSLASLVVAGQKRAFDQPRADYADDSEMRATFGYDYFITNSLVFRMKDEYLDKDYDQNENYLYSSYIRTTWRIAVEKVFSQNHSLELGYQENNEKHKVFMQNNLEEKSLQFSYLARF